MEKIVNINFDNLDDIDSSLTSQEFKERLKLLLQPILDKAFPENFQKRIFQSHIGRISFACPYCSDSAQNDHKKRGNFILTGNYKGFFKCHNCGEFKKISNFFKDFKVELKLDAINYLTENLSDFNNYETAKYDMSILLDMEHLDKYAIDRQKFIKHFELVEVKNSSVWPWLTNRLQYQTEKYLYNPMKNYLFILNLTQSGKILGTQKRKFSTYNRFETYKLSKLYELMEIPLEEIDDEQKNYLDMLSMIFNICLINFNKTVTLFEGPMDAFLFKNSIANTGANKELPIDIPVRYFYDSDETGKKKSLKYIDQKQEVFLWDRLINQMELPHKNKWDFNDLLIYIKKNNMKTPLFDYYFSRDPLDAIDI
jgi:hypothetical protein